MQGRCGVGSGAQVEVARGIGIGSFALEFLIVCEQEQAGASRRYIDCDMEWQLSISDGCRCCGVTTPCAPEAA